MNQPSVRTEYEKRQLAFYRYFQELQKQETVESMGRILLHFLQEWFQFDLIWIAQYEPQYQVLNGIGGILPKAERDADFLRRKQPILPGDLFDQVVLTGTLQEIPSLKQEQRVGDWQAVAQRQSIQGTIILPIRYRHQSFGAVLVGTTLWGGHPRPEEMTEIKLLMGTLGAEIHRLSSQTSTPSAHQSQQPSMEVMGQILAASTFEERLPLVLAQIHQTLQPARTCLYWFDTEAQSCRLQEIYTGPPQRRAGAKVPPPKLDLSLQSIASFYQSSLQNQTVAIADIQGLVNSNQAPTRLMALTKSRAWLSAPILEHGRLIAVLAAEENEPRLWRDVDKQSIQLMAQLMGQGSKTHPTDSLLAKGDGFGLNGLLNHLKDTYRDSAQWDQTLLQCLEQIGVQFGVRWAAVVTHHPENQDFWCRAQFFNKKKQQPLGDRLPELSDVDAKMLARMSDSIAMQSLTQDLRLLTWRQPLADRGVQSLLLLKLNPDAKAENLGSFLLLATDLPRTWIKEDIESATLTAQTLGQAFSQRDQWQQDALRVQFMTVLNQGLQAVQLTPPGDALFTTAAQALHTLLEVECVMIWRWSPEQPEATLAALINDSKFQVDSQTPILWQMDEFLQNILSESAEASSKVAFPHLVTKKGPIEDFAAESSGWLSGMGRTELLAVPLQIYPEDPCLGLVILLDSRRQYWTELKREGIQLLTRELTAHYRSHYLVERFHQKQATLECLNWYKQRHFEHISLLWTEQMSKFQTLLSSKAFSTAEPGSSRNRTTHPVGDLYNAFSSLESILKSEVWDLQLAPEKIPVATLLRRALARIEEVARTRQLWTQVHNLTPSVSLNVPGQKLELMLVELLLAACYRSKTGDRIDIWCRALPEAWVEISITDNGRLNPLLIDAIQQSSEQVPLAASILESVPGLHFKICKSLVERLGGQIELAQLEDGRALSRLILPVAPTP
jgi:GAF domain-containing protein